MTGARRSGEHGRDETGRVEHQFGIAHPIEGRPRHERHVSAQAGKRTDDDGAELPEPIDANGRPRCPLENEDGPRWDLPGEDDDDRGPTMRPSD